MHGDMFWLGVIIYGGQALPYVLGLAAIIAVVVFGYRWWGKR